LLVAIASGRGHSAHGRRENDLVMWGGLILPTLVLVVLVASAFIARRTAAGGPGFRTLPLRIEAHGRQWLWEFRYPEAGGVVTRDELHIPSGRDIEFTVTSADVIHSFWVPRLGGKIDAIPGHRNTILLMADRPGTYGGVCAEYCGDRPWPDAFTVVAHPPGDYDEALAAPLPEPRHERAGCRRADPSLAREASQGTVAHLGDAAGMGTACGRQPHRARQALHDRGLRVLRHRRRAGHAHPRAARDVGHGLRRTGDLRPDLHHAWHDHDVPVRDPDVRGLCDLSAAEDARRARHGLSRA
jgi:cytochrome c oxidase subunit 2